MAELSPTTEIKEPLLPVFVDFPSIFNSVFSPVTFNSVFPVLITRFSSLYKSTVLPDSILNSESPPVASNKVWLVSVPEFDSASTLEPFLTVNSLTLSKILPLSLVKSSSLLSISIVSSFVNIDSLTFRFSYTFFDTHSELVDKSKEFEPKSIQCPSPLIVFPLLTLFSSQSYSRVMPSVNKLSLTSSSSPASANSPQADTPAPS